MTNKAILAAMRKGRHARIEGKPRVCPYPDKTTDYRNSVTFSRAFRNAWFEGYDKAFDDWTAMKARLTGNIHAVYDERPIAICGHFEWGIGEPWGKTEDPVDCELCLAVLKEG